MAELIRFIYYEQQIKVISILRSTWIIHSQKICETNIIDPDENFKLTDKKIKKRAENIGELYKIFNVIQWIHRQIYNALFHSTLTKDIITQFDNDTRHIYDICDKVPEYIKTHKNGGLNMFQLIVGLAGTPFSTWLDNIKDYSFINRIKNTKDKMIFEPLPQYMYESDPHKAQLMANYELVNAVKNNNNNNGYNNNRTWQNRGRGRGSNGQKLNDAVQPKLVKLLKQKGFSGTTWRGKSPQGGKSKPCMYYHIFDTCQRGNTCTYSHQCKCGRFHPLKSCNNRQPPSNTNPTSNNSNPNSNQNSN